jgi:hypothetical protein
MDDQALFNQVFICALETVGFTQFLKQLLKGFNLFLLNSSCCP